MPVTTGGKGPADSSDAQLSASDNTPRRPRVALVGPRTDSHGGVAATMGLLRRSRLVHEFNLVVVSTYRDGTAASKALEAARGLARLMRLCATGRVDLVHVHTSVRGSLARKVLGIAIARAADVPVVLHVHSGSLFRAEGDRNQLLERFQRRVFRWALESSDAVVALTASWEQSLAGCGRIRRSSVIPNAPELTVLPSRTISGQGELILFLGHLYRNKGVYELLEAFAILRHTRPELRLVLAGEGSEAHSLRLHTRQLGLDAAVEFPGWVGAERKAELLASAACFVLPSYREGLPLALLEAMVAGIPVVATPVGGVPEVIQHDRHALLVPPRNVVALASALECVLDDPTLAARLSDAARRRALAKYTPDALAARVGSVYREVLARHPPRAS